MTNYVFILNAHGPLMVYEDGILKTALYDVFRNYSELCGPIAIATEIRSENFTTAVHQAGPDVSVTSTRIDASATKSQDGRHITLSLINRYRDRPCRVHLDFKNRHPQEKGVWHLLRADNLLEANTRDHPDRIRAHSREISLADEALDLPAASVSHLQVELT
jgi:alpha-L-arabinofuranosidase